MRKILILILILYTTCYDVHKNDENHNYNAKNLKFLDDHVDLYKKNIHKKYEVEKILNEYKNLNKDSKNDTHGASFLFMAGFIKGLELFNNVTHSKECLSVLPVIHNDFAEIAIRIRNMTEGTDVVELLKFIVEKIEHTEKKIESTDKDCQEMTKSVKKVFDKIGKHFQKEEKKGIVIFRHFLNNFGTVIQKAESSKQEIRNKQFYKAGIYAGDLLRFLVLWDFNPDDLEFDLEISRLINLE